MAKRAQGAPTWSDFPDSDRRMRYDIYSPTTDRDVHVVLLGNEVTGVYVHYYNRRTRPCMGSRETCEGCDLNHERRWKGYIAAWDRSKGRLCIAQVTQEAFLRCTPLQVHKGKLRGMVLRMVRAGSSKNSRVNALVQAANWEPGILPPAFDLKEALERIWFTVSDKSNQLPAAAEPPASEPGEFGQDELYKGDGPYVR